MSIIETKTWFTNRQFVAAIRAELDEAGHSDIAISRQWIEEGAPGYSYLVHAPVGAALTVPLKVMESFFEVTDMNELRRHAREFAVALANLKRAEKILEKYVRDVRAAAVAEIAIAQAAGVDILLEGVGFKPVYAYHLSGKDWKDAALHILAELKVRHTSFHLRPTTSALWVEEAADVAKELAEIVEDQRKRQNRLAELDALGADLIVDRITLDLLATHGLNAEETLERAWKEQCLNLKVDHLGRETSLALITSDGVVTSTIILEDAVWNGEHMWLVGDAQMKNLTGLVGSTPGGLVRHAAFESREVIEVFNRHADHLVFDLSEKFLFDADTGRIRPMQAAAIDHEGDALGHSETRQTIAA